ncbi:hypothetical protein L3Q72_23270 [Vibrio sp. JC009]|uniref:hypothetical protein n=1 Tax=Vibrio sp. JC009 TaxID=2912314 RepID=UPI0023B1768F|nr:hypothetical protein [Vibrio sp. JC009]WED24154.1 hypothetical protein L3Q72_23270 [Vibrio sp. JC009]
MAKLILHIGTHKTGTTTIQQDLYDNIDALESNKILYPTYSKFLGIKDHYAHLDIAKAIMDDSETINRDKVVSFFKDVYSYSNENDIEKVIISAEPFYRGLWPECECECECEFWEKKDAYINYLSQITCFDDIEVVIVLRKQDDYLESLYNEQVKVTRYSKNIMTFYKEFHERFEYKKQIEHWQKYFPTINVLTFDELINNGNLTKTFLENLNIDNSILEQLNFPNRIANESWPLEIVELKRQLNGSMMSLNELRQFRSMFTGLNLKEIGKFTFKYTRLDENARSKILDDHCLDNESILKNYFSENQAELFPAKRNSYPVVTTINTANAIAMLYKLNFK